MCGSGQSCSVAAARDGARVVSARRNWAWAALAALLIFEGVRTVAHARAVDVMSAQLVRRRAAAASHGTAASVQSADLARRGRRPGLCGDCAGGSAGGIRPPRRAPLSRRDPDSRHGRGAAHASLSGFQPLVAIAVLESHAGRRRPAPGFNRPAFWRSGPSRLCQRLGHRGPHGKSIARRILESSAAPSAS